MPTRGRFWIMWMVLSLWGAVAFAGDAVRPDDPLLKGIKLSDKATYENVAVASRFFLLMDVTGSRRLRFLTGIYNTAVAPPVQYSWMTADGRSFSYVSVIPDLRLTAGSEIWLKSAQIGEAVLLKVTCDEFPGDRKTVVTYNAAVRGIAQINGSSQQLLASEAPPYYNTFPVDAAKHGFQDSAYTPTSGRTGFATQLGLCDSATSPGIGLPYLSSCLNALMADSITSVTVRSVGFPGSWSGPLSPPESNSSLTSCEFGWGGDLPGYSGWIFFPGPAPIGDTSFDIVMDWHGIRFTALDGNYTSKSGFFFNPLPGGPALVGPTNAIKDAQVGNGVPARYVDAEPNNLQLLEAVDEYLSGRAVLATHLATLCDVNHDGVIDKADRTALVVALGLQGAITY